MKRPQAIIIVSMLPTSQSLCHRVQNCTGNHPQPSNGHSTMQSKWLDGFEFLKFELCWPLITFCAFLISICRFNVGNDHLLQDCSSFLIGSRYSYRFWNGIPKVLYNNCVEPNPIVIGKSTLNYYEFFNFTVFDCHTQMSSLTCVFEIIIEM